MYMSFFQDWGPLNVAMVYKACIYIHSLLIVSGSLFYGMQRPIPCETKTKYGGAGIGHTTPHTPYPKSSISSSCFKVFGVLQGTTDTATSFLGGSCAGLPASMSDTRS